MQEISRNFTLICLFVLFLLSGINGQEEWQQQGHILNVHFNYGVQFPGGDLQDRFGHSFQVLGAVEWQLDRSNWLLGLQGGLIFGQDVKEDVLAGLRDENGQINGTNNNAADVALRQRGLYVGGYIGKIITLDPDKPRSGIKIALGPGLLQHKIRLQDNNQSSPGLEGEYAKGYDRLTNGFALRQFIGYQNLSYSRTINFSIGIELTQAWTKNRRNADFNTMSALDEDRFDTLIGIRGSWILPFYLNSNPETFYY